MEEVHYISFNCSALKDQTVTHFSDLISPSVIFSLQTQTDHRMSALHINASNYASMEFVVSHHHR